ncbi:MULTISPECIES: DNA gyrase subunit A [unclassified Deinococcus]|uniref:DNA gyrase subunit A n=2 Tax=Deinococcus TaxID=1298 RepID=UPI000991B3A7|nr:MULTISPECIES: DNA gyrase subunit A [unclassified Deinococcus]MBX8464168.1 DNA gyrase subunit A [Deinococcus sp. RIT780]MCD0157893.1 DNA gyrase subunit A [Deinococcus sp. 6GRE01]MCD0162498.1 DNA gyrase subunit A [Deinococcus sp. 6YEL10]MCD0166275.1 DNA gyrase subunit A [Deinococcus sp. 12RED42]MCD0171338.1 DNA gyrase subunit A [Deinococcus sp. 23YEL01]
MTGILPVDITSEVKTNFINYAMNVIVDRALPDVRDGLKPVQRRIMYAMMLEGLYANQKHAKSASVVGEVMKKYHPHGDSSIYDAMVRLGQWWNMRYPMVHPQGNFGSIDGDPPAAMRYTEARMTKVAEEVLADLEKETVDLKPNYDETTVEPSVLPSAVPNLLINGASGIAVGMATNIPPHNLTEICNGLLALIDNPHIDLDGMMQHVTGPDFPTGGRISKQGIRDAYATGHSGLKVRGKARIEEKNGRNQIIISEIPYQVNKTNLIQTISAMYKAGKIPDISALRDESDRKDPVRIVVELKRGAIPTLVLNQLYKYTQLQGTFTVINLSIVNGEPRVLPLIDTMRYFLEHRRDVVTRRTQYELKKAEERAHILEGLIRALDHIDEVISLIRSSNTGAEARDSLMARFGLSEVQSQAILDMRLQRLVGLEREKLMAEFDELQKTIAFLRSILGDEGLLWKEIKKEIRAVRDNYGDERRSTITLLEEDISKEDLIAVEDMVITMTRAGYLKRTKLDAYRAQGRGGRGASGGKLRDEDVNTRVFVGSTHDFLLFFTDKGRVFHEKIYDLPEAGRDAKGTHIRNLLPGLRDDENIASVLSVKGFEEEGCFIFATRNGVVKKTLITDYGNITSAGLIAINLQQGDELISVGIVQDSDHVILATRNGKAMRFQSGEVRDTGRATQGVIGIRLREGEQDAVVSMALVPGGDEDSELLAVSECGLGKRTPVGEYPAKGRGGMGVITLDVTEKTGKLVTLARVAGDEELMVLTEKGTVIRTRVEEVRVTGRNAQGVKVINVSDKDSVISAFPIRREDEL